ncbi:MAG: hypothetical protein OXI79_00540 [Gammaproteobacteria bacterium]|nr:hypothetical protein [Gammaproteobacteria bacterium]
MAAVQGDSHWLPALGILARLIGSEVRAASRRPGCWVVLGLGIVNLLAGLLLDSADWLPTFVALDIVYANFAFALWIVTVSLGGQPPLVRNGMGFIAKAFAPAIVVVAMLTAAGTVAGAVQLWRGTAPLDLPLCVSGLYANLGVSTVHLALLAVAMQAILDRKWLSMGVTAIVWIATNLGFDHPLLRFGAPINPASGMNGYGPFLGSLVATGIYWTGCCIVLLAVGRWAVGRRSGKGGESPQRAMGPNTFAVVWTAAVAWAVSGGWIFHNASIGAPVEAVRNTPGDPPQPDYSRLDLDIVISPLDRFLASRGTAIVVNRHNVPIPNLHFGIPRALGVVALTTTGEMEGIDETAGCHRYRLNRPLEPKETLKVEFDLRWTVIGLADTHSTPRLVENGTFVSTADVIPALGCATGPHPFRTASPVAYRARLSTSLDQVAVTAGTLVRAWKENGWSFFEYESQGPISPFTTIHSGHYAIRREVRDERPFEVFYHPAHRQNVDRMIDAGRVAVAKRPKPETGQGVVRIVEVPDYQPFRNFGFLGIGAAETRRGRACPVPAATGGKSRRGRGQAPPLRAFAAERAGLVLSYSERGCPLSTPPPSESTPPRA